MIECGVVQHEDEQTCNRSDGPFSLTRSSMPIELAAAITDRPVRPYASVSLDGSAAGSRVVWSMTFRTDAVGPRNRPVMTEVDVTAVQARPVGPVKRLPAPRSDSDSSLPRITPARVSPRGSDRRASRRLDVVA